MITKMEHVAIIVNDMDESLLFYTGILGFQVRLRGSNSQREMSFLVMEGQESMEIELIRDIEAHTEYSNSGIVNHLAFTVKNIDESIAYFKEKGIAFISDEPKPTLEGGRMILFYGPSKELLQLVERA